MFVVGSAGSGFATNKVFIENGREHAKIAIQEIRKRLWFLYSLERWLKSLNLTIFIIPLGYSFTCEIEHGLT